MANIPMKTLRLHGLEDTYTIPTTPEHIGASPANTQLSQDFISAESVTFTIIGDPNISVSSSRQVAEIIITDQGGSVSYLSFAFDGKNGAPRSNLLEVATNGHNTIESVRYQTIGNETTYSIRYKSFKLYSLYQVNIPRCGNVSVESRGNDVTEGESLEVDTSNLQALHNICRPNGGWLTTAEDSTGAELDNLRRQGGWRLTHGVIIEGIEVVHLYHFNGVYGGEDSPHHFCCMQIGCSYGNGSSPIIRWNWYGSWSKWIKI